MSKVYKRIASMSDPVKDELGERLYGRKLPLNTPYIARVTNPETERAQAILAEKIQTPLRSNRFIQPA